MTLISEVDHGKLPSHGVLYENNADHAVPWEIIKDWIAAGFILLIVVCVAAVVRKKRASGSYRR
ncbi:hypothetical protein ACPV3A_30605 [Paenibacillus sp. Dod16]|uniref:hypothetical protein n=1 Tax=Paenibacillus sp. Dod16 TaxID=3416392 RepID=UPI003CFB3546